MIRKNIIFFIFLVSAHTTAAPKHRAKKAVTFELMNVLININIQELIKVMQPSLIISYFFVERKNPLNLIRRFYKSIDDAYGPPKMFVPDPYGNQLPQPFCDAIEGKITEEECIKTLLSIINTRNKKSFYSDREKKIIENAISIALDTKTLEKVLTINHQGFQFLKKESSKGHEIFIFSNFSKRAFEVVNRKYPQIFKLIPKENIILSSHEKSIKPQQKIYQKLYQRLRMKGIKPENCLCIEERRELAQMAESENFKSFII